MIDCICGLGDDGQHSETDHPVFGRIVSCPYAKPDEIWLCETRYMTPRNVARMHGILPG